MKFRIALVVLLSNRISFFFGESLPKRFHELQEQDFPKADFLIIIGTSLMVAPFNRLISFVDKDCPRLLINMEPAGNNASSGFGLFGGPSLNYDSKKNRRDVFYKGTCDNGVLELAKLLGWEKDFNILLKSVGALDENKTAATATPVKTPTKKDEQKASTATAAVKTPTKKDEQKSSAAAEKTPTKKDEQKASTATAAEKTPTKKDEQQPVRSSPRRTSKQTDRSLSPQKKPSSSPNKLVTNKNNQQADADQPLIQAEINADKLAKEMAKATLNDSNKEKDEL